jgi:hypothetical protein
MPAPYEQPCESQKHERACARLWRVGRGAYCLRQIVRDHVLAERVAEESKVAPFEAMGGALRCERIHPGHCVSRLHHTEINVQRHGIKGITRVEIIAVKSQSGGEGQRVWVLEEFRVS